MYRIYLSCACISHGMVYVKDFIYTFEGESFDLIVAASDGVFNSTTSITITMSELSIPEIVVIVVAVLACSIGHYRDSPLLLQSLFTYTFIKVFHNLQILNIEHFSMIVQVYSLVAICFIGAL